MSDFVERCRVLGLHPNKVTPDQRRAILQGIGQRPTGRRQPRSAARMMLSAARRMTLAEKAKAALAIAGSIPLTILYPVSDEVLEKRKGEGGCGGCEFNVLLADQDVACALCGCAKGFKFLKLRNRKAKCRHPGGSRWPA